MGEGTEGRKEGKTVRWMRREDMAGEMDKGMDRQMERWMDG